MIVGWVRGLIQTDDSPPQMFEVALDEENTGMSEDVLASFVGDGAARVSVSMAIDDKDYGQGFSANVTVSLTCNQDDENVRNAYDMARALAADYVGEAFDEAKTVFESRVNRKKGKTR